MEGSRFHVYLLQIFCLLRSISTQTYPPKNDFALFIFGDSLFDVGNNNFLKNPIGLSNFTPYGETYFHHPTGRFSDGRLISDFIAEYMKLPLFPPYLQRGNHQFMHGANLASGAVGPLVETHQGNEGRVVDLKTQVIQLKNVKKQISKQIGEAETKALLSKAIYLISMGGNDYIAPSSIFKSFSKEDYVGMVLGNLTSAIKDIYNIGGRKFVLIGMGAYECLPNMRALEQNKGVESGCGTGPYRGILSSCGLMEGYELCENVSDYVFFDSVHATEKLYNQVAQLIWSGSNNFTRPHNLKTLLHA